MIFSKPLRVSATNAVALGFALVILSSCVSSAGGQTIHLETLAQSQNCDVPRSEPYWLSVESHSDLPAAFSSTQHEGPYWLVGLGNKPTGGYSIKVAPKAKLQGNELQVEVTTTSPQGSIVSQAFTNPCVLLAVPVKSNITNGRWLENDRELIIPVQPYRARPLQQNWQ